MLFKFLIPGITFFIIICLECWCYNIGVFRTFSGFDYSFEPVWHTKTSFRRIFAHLANRANFSALRMVCGCGHGGACGGGPG